MQYYHDDALLLLCNDIAISYFDIFCDERLLSLSPYNLMKKHRTAMQPDMIHFVFRTLFQSPLKVSIRNTKTPQGKLEVIIQSFTSFKDKRKWKQVL